MQLALGALGARTVSRAFAGQASRVRPGGARWPSESDWASLARATEGRLQRVAFPQLDAAAAPQLLSNPFYLRSEAALTQSSGWLDAWRSRPSVYVVEAENSADVAAAVRFAARHRLRIVVKGGGHSYMGGSNAPDSLLVWTRRMNRITLHEAFVAQGAEAGAAVPAVSVGSGCIWLHVYDAVTTKAGRYVQGGGCTTVGVAGLVQGGGFGSFSKTFGLAAAGLLEAEIVTADGTVRTVNDRQDPDLFWALKGGGGGTFGVVTRLTLRTHDLPPTFGVVTGSVRANTDEAFHRLLRCFVDLYATTLFEPRWGEQARATPDNRLVLQMLFQGLSAESAQAAWSGLTTFLSAHPDDYRVEQPVSALVLPARHLWDVEFLREHLPSVIRLDERKDAHPGDYWWAGNTSEAGTFWHGYHSLWLPRSLLDPDKRSRLVDAWFTASRQWSVTLHFNKGLAGAPPEAIAASRDTCMNPQVLDAFALAILGSEGPAAFPGLPPPDEDAGRREATRMKAAIEALRRAAPDGGSYLSECDYFLKDWQRASWGEHWSRLSRIKRRYDPEDLFVVHHGVGSERWSADGFERI